MVVLFILTGATINVVFSDDGTIKEAQEIQNRANESAQENTKQVNELENLLNEEMEKNNKSDVSKLVEKTVTKNTKAVDAYGNKITIPKGFKIVAHGADAKAANYTYSGDNIPAVQDGIVIEDTQTETLGNQFVWVPVGTINNKSGDSRGATTTITLGRYSDFDAKDGVYTPVQSAENYAVTTLEKINSGDSETKTYIVGNYYYELNNQFEGNSAIDSTAQNTTARDLAEFISTTLANGGYYIARFEASGTTSKVTSKYDQEVLGNTTQLEAAKLAREMYDEVKEDNELLYASDLVNSYAWDTAIIFIQTYGTGEGASSYASQNKSTSFANTGKNNDKYCNIWDMSGNACEWTTEHSTMNESTGFGPCNLRGGFYNISGTVHYASYRGPYSTRSSVSTIGFRVLLYVE